MCQVQESKNHL